MAKEKNTLMLFSAGRFADRMPSPSDAGLPYTSWRKAQLDAIMKVLLTTKRVVVLEAPTGVGKSGIAIAVGRLSGLPTTILTGTKQLQEQYRNLGIPTAMGRANFLCVDEDDTCEASCEVDDGSDGDEVLCPYRVQRDVASKSPVCVLNYQYWLRETMSPRSAFIGRDVLVMDEAHLAETEFTSVVKKTLSMNTLMKYGIDEALPDDLQSWVQWHAWAMMHLDSVDEQARELRRVSKVEKTFRKEARKLTALAMMLLWLTSSPGGRPDWVISEEKKGIVGPLVTFQPVWVREHTGYWLGTPRKIILMSATILDPTLLTELLGVDPSEVEYISLPSPFDVKRRPLYYIPSMKVNAAAEDFSPMLDVIEETLNAHTHDKGLIHAQSYKLANVIMGELSDSGRLVTHTSRDKVDSLNEFKQSTLPLVLVSPSMTTGVDLPYDQLRFQIIAKLPFPDRGDLVVAARLRDPDIGQRWYSYVTACAVEQAYGRAMRSEDDYGTTYLIDANWSWFYRQNQGILSPWFKEAIVRV